MKVTATIDIYDADRILRAYLSAKYGTEVIHLIVKSWNQTVFEVDDDCMLTTPGRSIRHVVREEHSIVFKPKS